jgi:oxygen-dependent protoporphyrinogen oxidase
MNEKSKVVVVGGGVAGLCVANLLAKSLDPRDVLLLDSSDQPGGNARTDEVAGFVCDWGPNGFIDKEPHTLEWVESLELGASLLQANELAAHRFLLLNDRLVELVSPPKFFFSPMLSVGGRLRMLREPLVKARRDSSTETIWNFAARRIGPEAADNLVSALVVGVFGGDARQLSLAHCFPNMAAMEREHGGLVKAMIARRKEGGGGPMGPSGTLTTFQGGIGRLTERAAHDLGDRIRLGCEVSSLERDGNRYRLKTSTGNVEARHVVLASPAYRTAEIIRSLDPQLSDSLAVIQYAPIAVVCTGYPRDRVEHDMKGFGFLVPPNQKKRILGCIWTSSIFPEFTCGNYVFLRTMIGGALNPEGVNLSDNELLDVVAADVHSIMGIHSSPEFTRIYRHPHGIPQYLCNHGDILTAVASAESRYPGLIFAGSGYHGVSINDCVVSAHRAANRIVGNRDPGVFQRVARSSDAGPT